MPAGEIDCGKLDGEKIHGGKIDSRLANAAAARSTTRSLNAKSSTAPWTMPAVYCAVSGSIRPNSVRQIMSGIVRLRPFEIVLTLVLFEFD
jgi:hypothetical protein